jgi:hypothetical protein
MLDARAALASERFDVRGGVPRFFRTPASAERVKIGAVLGDAN